MTDEESRFTDPVMAVDHVRRIARETAAETGYRAAASAVLDLRREYRIMPLKRKDAAPARLAAVEAALAAARERETVRETPAGHRRVRPTGPARDLGRRATRDQGAGGDGHGRHQGPRLVRRADRDPSRPATPPAAGLGAGPNGGTSSGRTVHPRCPVGKPWFAIADDDVPEPWNGSVSARLQPPRVSPVDLTRPLLLRRVRLKGRVECYSHQLAAAVCSRGFDE